MTIEEFVERWYWHVGTEKNWGPDTEQMTADLHALIENAIQEHDKIVDKVKAKMKYLTPEGGDDG